MTLNIAGTSVVRRDLEGKLTGEASYTADLKLPGMLYGAILRSPHPSRRRHQRGCLRGPATARHPRRGHALRCPRRGRLAPDTAILDTRVRFVGDEVAAVAADDPDTARAALELIRVEYAALPHYMTPESALSSDAVSIHPGGNLALGEVLSLERGSVAEGFAEADVVLEDDFEIPTPLRRAAGAARAALASWGEDDDADLIVWKTTRGVHVDREALAVALGVPASCIRVVGPHLGAGYGNKDESRLSALVAVLSPTGRTPGADGILAGGRVHRRAGAPRPRGFTFAPGSGPTAASPPSRPAQCWTPARTWPPARAWRGAPGRASCTSTHCANVKYEAHLAYTNRPTAGSYRALGAPQGHFALESLMDRAAGHFGMDPLDFRLMNHVRPEGQPGQRVTPLDRVVDSQPPRRRHPPSPATGCASAWSWAQKPSAGAGISLNQDYPSPIIFNP